MSETWSYRQVAKHQWAIYERGEAVAVASFEKDAKQIVAAHNADAALREAAFDALWKYGMHKRIPCMQYQNGTCDCGYDDALSALRSPATGEA
jgi:hypothetical protein